jgi:hypothetical protein
MTRAIPVVIYAVAVLAILAVAISVRAGHTDTADQAWTDRLNGQAAAVQKVARIERAEAAYRDRMLAMARAYFDEAAQQEQSQQAWTDRLNGLAQRAGVATGMSPRVAAAWTARLNGLAAEATAAGR